MTLRGTFTSSASCRTSVCTDPYGAEIGAAVAELGEVADEELALVAGAHHHPPAQLCVMEEHYHSAPGHDVPRQFLPLGRGQH